MRRLALVLLLGVAGCTVGPDYHRPALPAAFAPWLNPVAPGQVAERWWTQLGDAPLDRLVEQASAANLDLREAQARLREARANRAAALGGALPQLRATGSATQNQVSENGQFPVARIPGFNREFSLFDAGFDASWELDLWGGARRSIEAADARSRQAEARLAEVRLQAIAEVVRNYADLRAAQRRDRLLRAELALRTELAGLAALRYQAGEAPRSELEAAEQRANSAAAAIAEPGAAAAAAAYRLALLTGQPPEALQGLLAQPAALPEAPALVAGGLRSELLLRRPDIRAAEAELAAANADIGVQTAQLYPRLTLSGAIGQQAQAAGDLTSAGSTRYAIGPGLVWPVFSFGRIRAQVRAADARTAAALARYEKAVLGALADSETAANRFAAAGDALARRRAALARGAAVAALAELRFGRGEDDRLQLLEARAAVLALEQQELAAAGERLAAFVALSKSLGGSPPGP